MFPQMVNNFLHSRKKQLQYSQCQKAQQKTNTAFGQKSKTKRTKRKPDEAKRNLILSVCCLLIHYLLIAGNPEYLHSPEAYLLLFWFQKTDLFLRNDEKHMAQFFHPKFWS